MVSIKGEVALITGGGRGMGRGIANSFAKNGADVAIIGRDPDALKSTKKEIESLGVRCFYRATDVTLESQVMSAVKDIMGEFGRIDFLINNAGTYLVKSVIDTTMNDWDNIVDTNLKGTFLCTREVLNHMINVKKGTIINIASVGGRIGLSNKAAYCASKFGVVGFSKALAKEVKKHRIRVHIIYPYYVDSDKSLEFSEPDKSLKVNRIEDIGDLIIYLATTPLRVSIEEIAIDPYLKG